ncbi:hypothetical protein AB8E32_08450 [Marinomonas polaris]|uniref:hypothetical protein n=1 Tax=Marinomonas polaris TaxID=293552 RepID=UPI003512A399
MNQRRYMKGSLLIKLLVVCGLIGLFLPFLVIAIARMQERHLLAQTYQDQHTIKAAIDAHLKAQWSRLLPASCTIDESLYLTIESGMSPPIRLATRRIDKNSDWLQGADYGLCRSSVTVRNNPMETTMACHWKAGDRTTFSSCESNYSGHVLSDSASKSQIKLEDDAAIGQSGVIQSEDGFYWYIAEGKDVWSALWRTPEESGKSLELWNGLERFAVFPLLDNSRNGLVDTLDTEYGRFPLKNLRGLWVEYQYRLSDCKANRDAEFYQEYHSMRGEKWHYHSPCQGVGNQIIVL